MIAPAYVRTMSAYNREMNRRIYAAASRLPDEARRAEGGAFWGSIHGTLNHLLWGDQIWMSRFAGWAKPVVTQKESAHLIAAFPKLAEERERADRDICAWADTVGEAWLGGNLTWFSDSAQREVTAPRAFLVVHMFNHQTHHRGQAHALLTRAGEATGDTDLFMVLKPSRE
ncbi:MAG: DinB family protein [Hyphomicrobiales bacterium]